MSEPTDASYWRERWASGRIGFHEGAPNALLDRHKALLDGHTRVLVPFSGKTVDLAFLAQRGHTVVGVELVEEAAKAFFTEGGMAPTRRAQGPFVVYEAAGVRQLVGNFFALPKAQEAPFAAAYDRAALVAVEPAMRAAYVEVLLGALQAGGVLLLVVFVYDATKLDGPPWSVDDESVRRLFGDRCDVELVERRAVEAGPRFLEAGVQSVEELAYKITKR